VTWLGGSRPVRPVDDTTAGSCLGDVT